MINNATRPSDLDVVYVLKEDENNEELRYSLRSLTNLPHRKVFIAGYKPSWVKNIEHLPIVQSGRKYDNVSHSGVFRTICNNDDISNDFVLMNDDFFVINRISQVPNLRRLQPIDHYIELYDNLEAGDKYYCATMKDTAAFLRQRGFQDVDSYELHVPMVINKDRYLELRSMYPKGQSLHMRTLYGNYYHVDGKRIKDVKVVKDGVGFSKETPFLSTLDELFKYGEVGRYIRAKFPNKSRYEKK